MTGTADELLAEWATWMRAGGMSTATVTGRLSIIRCAANAIGTDPLTFTPADLTGWLAGFDNASTRSTYYRGLKAWHGWLADQGHRVDDPTSKLRRPRQPKGVPHPVSTIGLQRLLEWCAAQRTYGARTRAMVLLAAYQGLRVHEVAKLRGEDIDLDEGTLRVLGKGGRHAVLPLHPEVAAVAARMPSSGYWFKSSKYPGRPVASESVSLVIANSMKRAGVRGSAHSLRHWYATNLLREGADLRVVQKLMRHTSLATTEGYLEVADGAQLAAVLRLPGPRVEAPPAVPLVAGLLAPRWAGDHATGVVDGQVVCTECGPLTEEQAVWMVLRDGFRRPFCPAWYDEEPPPPTEVELAALRCPWWCDQVGHYRDTDGTLVNDLHMCDVGGGAVGLVREDPGPAMVTVYLENGGPLTPAQAREVAARLLDAADLAEQDPPPSAAQASTA